MRGDRSFAYDLVVPLGPVNSRHALLCGSIEGKPPWTRPVTPIFCLVFTRRLKGNIQKYQTQSKLLYKVLSYISPRTKGVPRRPDKGGGKDTSNPAGQYPKYIL